MREYKVIDLFCGTGGFSKGFENYPSARFRTILGIDLLPVAMETFQATTRGTANLRRHQARPPGDASWLAEASMSSSAGLRARVSSLPFRSIR